VVCIINSGHAVVILEPFFVRI